MASENRVGPGNFQTKTHTNTQAATTIAKGEIFTLGENMPVFAVEAIGTTLAAISPTFPGGGKAAICIESELCVMDKNTAAGNTFAVNDTVYFDSVIDGDAVIDAGQATTNARQIGIAEGAATTSDATVLVSGFRSQGAPKFV